MIVYQEVDLVEPRLHLGGPSETVELCAYETELGHSGGPSETVKLRPHPFLW
ncbi:hypothetical protein M404DRAFT_1006126 [Pisolithus tinctorius Marx 270]|uniref:Uncharacterized protein n=1 Tax=Pisolithus tinctorius Marx 270 TaxID=870435 RepID=A0A0C3JIE0_PISTI|nr:hypothetical protein M404DRAFT_1006126 [Pisolithus tinctorius Marx 270]